MANSFHLHYWEANIAAQFNKGFAHSMVIIGSFVVLERSKRAVILLNAHDFYTATHIAELFGALQFFDALQFGTYCGP